MSQKAGSKVSHTPKTDELKYTRADAIYCLEDEEASSALEDWKTLCGDLEKDLREKNRYIKKINEIFQTLINDSNDGKISVECVRVALSDSKLDNI